MIKVMIGIPSLFDIPIVFMEHYSDAVKLRKDVGLIKRLNIRGTNTVTARNGIVSKFLDTDYTHIFFMDSDMVFPKDTLQRLLDRDVDIVGGFYLRKRKGFLPNSFKLGARVGVNFVTELSEILNMASLRSC